MKVYVISPTVEKPLAKEFLINSFHNPEIEVVPVYYSNQISLEYNLNRLWHKETYGFELSESEYDLHLTHRFAWQSFLDGNEPFACFVEEGINVDLNYNEILKSISLLDGDWDVFFPYDMFKHVKQLRDKDLSKMLQENINIHDIVEDDPYYLGFHWGSTIYFLSRKGCHTLCQNTEVKQRVEDEIFLRTEFDDLHTYYDDVDWYNIGAQKNEIPKERIDNIRKAVLGFNVWDSRSTMLVKEMLKTFSELALRYNIDLLLQAGSHLGFVRHGGIMPWDDDVDLGIHEDYVEKFVKELSIIPELEIKLFFEGPKAYPYYKIWHKNGASIPEFDHKFPFIDLWIYRQFGDDLIFKNGIICKDSNRMGFTEVIFEGAKVKIPCNSLDVLDSRYFDWRTSIRVYMWSHQNERMSNFPLKTSIEVDKNGRIIN